jgi:hypothetical protein
MMTLFSVVGVSMLALTLSRTDNPDAATLGGRVIYVDGDAIAGAVVSAYNVFTREVKRVKSDATGSYMFTDMRPGRYTVFVKAEGYCQKWVIRVFLFRGQHTQLDLVLTGRTFQGSGCIEVSGAKQ